jgi:uncharacterized protein YjdB
MVRSLGAQPSLRITSPADGTVLRPGQVAYVTVEPSPAGAFQGIAIIGADPIGFGDILTALPYRFKVQIPSGIRPLRYALTATGKLAPGKIAMSAPIMLTVERADTPVNLTVEPSSLHLRSAGDIIGLRVIGKYADGSETDIRESVSTTYVSDDPSIASVSRDGVVKALAPGTTHIVINGTYALPVMVSRPVPLRLP